MSHCTVTQYQSQLLSDIYRFSCHDAAPGLQIYQHNLHMTAARSLSVTYPVLSKMLGKQAIEVLARRLLAAESPQSGDWADWGYGMAECLQQSELHDAHPYLAEMAAFEWRFHQVSRSTCCPLDNASLNRLTDAPLGQIFIRLQAALTAHHYRFPIYGLWQLHRAGADDEIPTKADLEKVMNTSESGYCVMSQGMQATQISVIDEQEFLWLKGIAAGLSIEALLDTYPAIDFARWLAAAIAKEWLIRLD